MCPARLVQLPGGVTVDLPCTGSARWACSSLLGHTVVTGDGSTASALRITDPSGQPLDPTTRPFGTNASGDTGVLDDTAGWHQKDQKIAETAASTRSSNSANRPRRSRWAESISSAGGGCATGVCRRWHRMRHPRDHAG